MAPRKPSSVFVIVEDPSTVRNIDRMPATSLNAWRIALGDDTIEDVVARVYEAQPVGSTVIAFEDTKGKAFRVGVKLEEIDDVRVEEEPGTEAEPLGLEPK